MPEHSASMSVDVIQDVQDGSNTPTETDPASVCVGNAVDWSSDKCVFEAMIPTDLIIL